MHQMLTLLSEKPVAAAAGILGMLCFVTYPLFRARPLLLTVYLGNNVAFAAHYALLDHATAAIMNMVMAVQTLVAIGLVRWPSLRWTYYALIPVLLGAAAMTWQGWLTLLPATAATLSTLGRMQSNETALRALLLVSAPFWAVHDVLVGSLPGEVSDVFCIAAGSWMLFQHLRMTGIS